MLTTAPRAEWPATLPERIRAVRQALTTHAKPATAADIANQFTKANTATVAVLWKRSSPSAKSA